MARKFGVKFRLRRVGENEPQPRDDVITEWDRRLGIVDHSLEEYSENLHRIRAATARGDDPYDFAAFLASCGYVPDWTPCAPSSSLEPSQTEVANGQKGGNRSRNPGRNRSNNR